MMSDIVGPLLQWLNTHPNSAGLATFIISAAESIAIIGTVVPGSVTMTAIGTLAGAGVIPFWVTIICAIFGAIVGDNISFWIGHHFKRRLPTVWPFRNYPQLLQNGENFFQRYGMMSVFIGRFIGPVRALVPIVAGMLDMPPLRYIPVSIIASILWAPAYMLPGILLGAASLELPPDVAVHALLMLLLVALFFLICSWLILKFFFLVGHQIDQSLNSLWEKLRRSPYFQFWTKLLQHHDAREKHGQLTLAFYFIVACALFAYVASVVIATPSQDILVDKIFFYSFRSFRTACVDNFMLVITLLGDKRILSAVTLVLFAWLAYKKCWRTAWHALALLFMTVGSVLLVKHFIHSPRPWGIVGNAETFSFPSGHTTISSTFYIGLGLLLLNSAKVKCRWPFYWVIALLVATISISRLYLGAHWFTDMAAGWILSAALLILISLSYRRKPADNIPVRRTFFITLIVLIVLVSGVAFKEFGQMKQNYSQVNWPTQTITLSNWWEQKGDDLPLYRIGRVGLPSEVFNLQWFGDLTQIQDTLLKQGWEMPAETTWINIVDRVMDVSSAEHLPLVAPLYLDKKPVLALVKHMNGDKKLVVLRLWESNYIVEGQQQPLWVGSVGSVPRTFSWLINYKRSNNVDVNTALIFAAMPEQYSVRSVEVNLKHNHHWKQQELILIKPKD